jgi:hypothetical protein
MKCTNSDCDAEATRIMAYEGQAVRCMWVAPYCDEHPGVPGAIFAAGPALSKEAQKIDGIRR